MNYNPATFTKIVIDATLPASITEKWFDDLDNDENVATTSQPFHSMRKPFEFGKRPQHPFPVTLRVAAQVRHRYLPCHHRVDGIVITVKGQILSPNLATAKHQELLLNATASVDRVALMFGCFSPLIEVD